MLALVNCRSSKSLLVPKLTLNLSSYFHLSPLAASGDGGDQIKLATQPEEETIHLILMCPKSRTLQLKQEAASLPRCMKVLRKQPPGWRPCMAQECWQVSENFTHFIVCRELLIHSRKPDLQPRSWGMPSLAPVLTNTVRPGRLRLLKTSRARMAWKLLLPSSN